MEYRKAFFLLHSSFFILFGRKKNILSSGMKKKE
jgi:hypothetical protein